LTTAELRRYPGLVRDRKEANRWLSAPPSSSASP